MAKRIIDGNEPAAPLLKAAAYNRTEYLGMSILLQIAKDFTCAHITGSVYAGFPYDAETIASISLKDAETLIKTYNERPQ